MLLYIVLYKEIIKYIGVIIRIAFIILFERKILSSLQERKGPTKIYFKGVLQPLSDFLKLFLKKNNYEGQGYFKSLILVIPFRLLIIFFLFWWVLPFNTRYNPNIVFFWFFLCLGFNIYPIIFSGWYTNCKYGYISCYRRLGQIISYELVLILFIISIILISKDLNIRNFYFISIFLPIIRVPLLLSILIELNRTPFDFSEAERELVSGYITEYGGFYFRFFFLSEYGIILFFSILIRVILYHEIYFIPVIILLIIITRRILPRSRYDKLIKIAWKVILPVGVCLRSTRYFLSI